MTRPDSGSADQSANQDDAVWLDLVARLEGTASEDSVAPNVPANPDTQGGTDTPGSSLAPAATPEPPATFRDFDPLGLAGEARSAEGTGAAQDGPAGPRDYAVEDEGGEFVPEEPPSLSGTEPLTMLAWLGAVGGPTALLLSAMFWRSAPLLAIVGMVSVFIMAVVYLVMKLPQEKDDNDDGARV